MKTITMNVSEPVYQLYQAAAAKQDKTTAEIVREAMEAYISKLGVSSESVLTFKPLSLGAELSKLGKDDDLLDEMLP